MEKINEIVTKLGGVSYTPERVICDKEERKLMMDCFDLDETSDYVQLLDAIGGSLFNAEVHVLD